MQRLRQPYFAEPSERAQLDYSRPSGVSVDCMQTRRESLGSALSPANRKPGNSHYEPKLQCWSSECNGDPHYDSASVAASGRVG